MMNPEPTETKEPFIKKGVVRAGDTPSVVSGEKSDHVKRGQAYAPEEPEVDAIEDLASEI